MYRFVLGDLACACDTAEELREAAGLSKPARVASPEPVVRKKRKYRRRTRTMEPAKDFPAEPEVTEAPKKRRRKKAKRTTRRTTKVNTYNVADLPLIKEGISWEVVEKVAKRLGKKVLDKRQLRSDLLARKKMG